MRTDSPATNTSTPPVSPRASTYRRPSRSDASGDLRAALLVITGAVGLIQLIAWVHLANQLFVFSSDYSPLAARQDPLCQTVVSPNDRVGDDPPRDPKRRFPERHVGPFYENPTYRSQLQPEPRSGQSTTRAFFGHVAAILHATSRPFVPNPWRRRKADRSLPGSNGQAIPESRCGMPRLTGRTAILQTPFFDLREETGCRPFAAYVL